MGGLLPRHSKHWWPLVEDIFTSPAVQEMAQQLLDELASHEELPSISIDATMRCCLPVMGQVHPRASAEDKEKAVFRENQAKTRLTCPIICVLRTRLKTCCTCEAQVLTARGRTNAVLCLHAVSMDDATSVARALADTVSARGLAQIQFVFVDNPSVRLVQELRCVCPNL